MGDDVEIKRAAVKEVYSSVSWKHKVDGMSAQQVIAIYIRFKNEGKLG